MISDWIIDTTFAPVSQIFTDYNRKQHYFGKFSKYVGTDLIYCDWLDSSKLNGFGEHGLIEVTS